MGQRVEDIASPETKLYNSVINSNFLVYLFQDYNVYGNCWVLQGTSRKHHILRDNIAVIFLHSYCAVHVCMWREVMLILHLTLLHLKNVLSAVNELINTINKYAYLSFCLSCYVLHTNSLKTRRVSKYCGTVDVKTGTSQTSCLQEIYFYTLSHYEGWLRSYWACF